MGFIYKHLLNQRLKMTKKPTIAVIGAGKWGQALHFALSQNQETFITSRTPRDIKNFTDLNTALKCDYLIITIPAQQLKSWLKEKNEIYSAYVPTSNIGFISGPSFAAEVIKALPCALVLNSSSKKLYDEFSPFFPSFIKTYYSSDVIGAEVAGAYKNVLAIASGICEGLNLGKNAQASLISRGLVEMYRFGKKFGAQESTFLGLSGAGDLFLTASSPMSRNYRVGLGLAENKKLNEILEDLGEVAEGVKTSEAISKLSNKHDVYTPIANEVKLILEGKNPKDSLKDLLSS